MERRVGGRGGVGSEGMGESISLRTDRFLLKILARLYEVQGELL